MVDEIQGMLDQLADLQEQYDEIIAQKQVLIDSVITPEIKTKIAEIEAEFAGKAEVTTAKTADLRGWIIQAVLQRKASVRGTKLQAVYSQGRVSWDTAGLDQAIRFIPAIADFKKKGKPYITIREV